MFLNPFESKVQYYVSNIENSSFNVDFKGLFHISCIALLGNQVVYSPFMRREGQ